ncbi:DUF2927 domain-containing protein, partial [Rhodoplanes roseus]
MILAVTPSWARDAARRAPPEPDRFTDRQILRGFLAVALGAEYSSAPSDRIRRFEGPVRVFVDAAGAPAELRPARLATVDDVVAEIGRGVAHLDIAGTPERASANLTVLVVTQRSLPAAVGAVFGRARAKDMLRRLEPQCVSGLSRDASQRILQAVVVLAADVSDFDFRDCAIEEILQALGPINDTAAVPWTMFNDAVRTGRFRRYDRYLLGLLYHPRMRAGLTRAEAAATARAVLPAVRAAVDGEAPGGPS